MIPSVGWQANHVTWPAAPAAVVGVFMNTIAELFTVTLVNESRRAAAHVRAGSPARANERRRRTDGAVASQRPWSLPLRPVGSERWLFRCRSWSLRR